MLPFYVSVLLKLTLENFCNSRLFQLDQIALKYRYIECILAKLHIIIGYPNNKNATSVLTPAKAPWQGF